MKKNYKLVLEYNGEHFFGSQANKDAETGEAIRTVQGELESALKVYFKSKNYFGDFATIFSSRTDSGVHAVGQVLNLQTDYEIPEQDLLPAKAGKFIYSINGILATDACLTKIEEVENHFHARFDAKSREYLYKIFIRPQRPVLRLDTLHWEKSSLDFERMQEQAKVYLGAHNFYNYCKPSEAEEKNSYPYICTVFESEMIKESSICYKYRIRANRFLRNMVRKIVAELIEVGKGQEIISAKLLSEKPVVNKVPAKGLTLMSVEY